MSTMRTSSLRRGPDHFEPDASDDPQAQRRLRGFLEQIDYTAYASNREVIGTALRHVDAAKMQKLAVACAAARARWAAAALKASDEPHPLSPDEAHHLTHLRTVFEELAEAYDGLRRMVERGYLGYRPEG
ncbi:MAG: hypothetical protein IT546_14035 [Caulobacteraceae bacterium]|nr:hypothetical protein [Caulobacteraceae bacterium]